MMVERAEDGCRGVLQKYKSTIGVENCGWYADADAGVHALMRGTRDALRHRRNLCSYAD